MPRRRIACPTALVDVTGPAPLLGPLACRIAPSASVEADGWLPRVEVLLEVGEHAPGRRLIEDAGAAGQWVHAVGGRVYRRWDLPESRMFAPTWGGRWVARVRLGPAGGDGPDVLVEVSAVDADAVYGDVVALLGEVLAWCGERAGGLAGQAAVVAGTAEAPRGLMLAGAGATRLALVLARQHRLPLVGSRTVLMPSTQRGNRGWTLVGLPAAWPARAEPLQVTPQPRWRPLGEVARALGVPVQRSVPAGCVAFLNGPAPRTPVHVYAEVGPAGAVKTLTQLAEHASAAPLLGLPAADPGLRAAAAAALAGELGVVAACWPDERAMPGLARLALRHPSLTAGPPDTTVLNLVRAVS